MTAGILGFILIASSYGTPGEATVRTYEFDSATGTAEPVDSLHGLSNPSFVAATPDGGIILTANENDGSAAGLTVLRRTAPGRYAPGMFRQTEGNGPCHVAIAPNGRFAVTSNYSGGSISIFPFDVAQFSLGEPKVVQFEGCGADSIRQAQPHAHFTTFTPDGSLMITDDLGTDRLHIFPIGRDGFPDTAAMTDMYISPGGGPRHLVFAPNGHHAYLINEIDGMVTHLIYDGKTLAPRDRILADYQHGQGSGDIHISPDGRFIYVSNRLRGDGIAIFAVDEATGALSPVGFTPTGRHPRNFMISPDGAWLLVACRDDNRIEIYSRDTDSGTLLYRSSIPATRPVCLIAQ